MKEIFKWKSQIQFMVLTIVRKFQADIRVKGPFTIQRVSIDQACRRIRGRILPEVPQILITQGEKRLLKLNIKFQRKKVS